MVQIHNSLRYIRKNSYLYSKHSRVKLILFLFVILSITFHSTFPADSQESSKDTDGDGYPDDIDEDDDNDGYNDTVELAAGTEPLNNLSFPTDLPVDSDGDSIPDSTDPDDDNDGLSDVEEAKINTNPDLMDTDEDLLFDFQEVKLGTDPLKKDTDNDTFWDGEELQAGTEPLDSNSYPTSVIADAGPDQVIYPNEILSIDGTFSIGNIINYSWDFDASDGIQSESNQKKVKYTYNKERIYTVTLIVTDGKTTDNDTCLIIVNQKLGARLDVVKSYEKKSISYQDGIKLNFQNRTNNSVIIEVIGNLSTSALVILTIDSYTMMALEQDEIIVKFDDLIINHSNIIEVVSSNGNNPLYNISLFYNKLQIIMYIPHFSKHTIIVEMIVEVDQPDQDLPKKPEQDVNIYWIFIGIVIVIIVIPLGLAYSYKKSENIKYYSKLNIDDGTKIISPNKIERKKINWEEYDSEK